MLMNRIFPFLGVAICVPLLALAQAPTAPPGSPVPPASKPDEPPTEAERLLDDAIKKVASLQSVSADLSQDVSMLGQSFTLTGQYLKADNHRLYFKLVLSGLGDSTGTMLQVCDGTTMWDFQQVLKSQVYRKFDIQPVLQQLNAPEVDESIRERIVSSLGFAGPDALLLGLRRSIRFDQKEEGEVDGRKVWILRGSWKDREGLVGPNQQPLPPTAPLPAYIPSVATVTVGQEDGWPYEVALEGRVPPLISLDNRRIGPDGRPVGRAMPSSSVEPSMITIKYRNVQLNPQLPPETFAFQAPPGAQVDDSTQELVRQLQAAAQVSAAQKKQAAQQGAAGIDAPTGLAAPGLPAPGAPGTAPTP